MLPSEANSAHQMEEQPQNTDDAPEKTGNPGSSTDTGTKSSGNIERPDDNTLEAKAEPATELLQETAIDLVDDDSDIHEVFIQFLETAGLVELDIQTILKDLADLAYLLENIQTPAWKELKTDISDQRFNLEMETTKPEKLEGPQFTYLTQRLIGPTTDHGERFGFQLETPVKTGSETGEYDTNYPLGTELGALIVAFLNGQSTVSRPEVTYKYEATAPQRSTGKPRTQMADQERQEALVKTLLKHPLVALTVARFHHPLPRDQHAEEETPSAKPPDWSLKIARYMDRIEITFKVLGLDSPENAIFEVSTQTAITKDYLKELLTIRSGLEDDELEKEIHKKMEELVKMTKGLREIEDALVALFDLAQKQTDNKD